MFSLHQIISHTSFCFAQFQVRKPAEAEKFRLEKIAEANRCGMQRKRNDHSLLTLSVFSRARIVLEAEAEAEAVAMKGEAEAFAVEAKAKAEAEQMAKKADAWKEYEEAALVDMMLEKLPKVAAEVAAPLARTNKITMVADGDGQVRGEETFVFFKVNLEIPRHTRNIFLKFIAAVPF